MDIKNQVINYRRYFHQNPEIGFQCQQTIKYIQTELEVLGYDTILLLDSSALIATLNNKKPTTIALRSDVDALNIVEQTNLSFKSTNSFMHACGHDAHAAMLLTAAHLIIENRHTLNCNVKLIFQPAEEGPLPGGAIHLVESKLLDDVDFFFAFHVTNKLKSKTVGIKRGEAFAAPDLFEGTVTGKSCHASTPHLGNNPILVITQIIKQFEELHQKLKNNNIVISTTFVNSGTTMNIIPDTATIKGTARSFTNETRKYLNQEMTSIFQNECKKSNAKGEFKFHFAYDPVFNHEEACEKMKQAIIESIGPSAYIELALPEMVGEDFSYYSRIGKSCIAWLGVRGENQEFYDLHNSSFLIDEEALQFGVQIFYNLVKNFK